MEIQSCVKKGKCYHVRTCSGDSFRLHGEVAVEVGVANGKSYSDSRWCEILYSSRRREAWEALLRILSGRAHSESELRRKLAGRKFPMAVIDDVLESCRSLKLADDREFAAQYAVELIGKGLGLRLVRAKMLSKGVAGHIVEEELAKLSFDSHAETASAREALRRKLRSAKVVGDDRAMKDKLFRYLMSKGFSYETSSEVIGELC
ncbi:MAG: regulatory protein RecX [Victivallales bacterium]|nr:regulatory protein RecX [Victivallales bacterium]